MFEAENIKDWRGHAVLDAEGRRIGELESVYVDTASDEPAFSAVLVGLPTRRRLVFVPLDGATVGPGHLKVRVSRKQVKNAPSIDRDGELLAEEEAAVFAHYERPYRQGAGGRRLARR